MTQISSEVVLRINNRVNGAPSRDVRIGTTSARVVGVSSKSIPVVKDPMDITSDEDGGFRTFLDKAGTKKLDLQLEGKVKTNELRAIYTDNVNLIIEDVEIVFPVIGRNSTGDRIIGDFYFANYTESGGDTSAPLTFRATFRSTDQWHYLEGF